MLVQVCSREEPYGAMPVLVAPFPTPLRVVSSAPWGGGLGLRRFVLNAQVPPGYTRHDPDAHLAAIARTLRLDGPGVGMLTAADVAAACTTAAEGVEVVATVALGHPIRAAAPAEDGRQATAGTINVIALLPVRLSDAALVNAVATATEAKVQALGDLGFDATGTATDAIAVACPAGGAPEPFGGPRSLWGSRLARAVHAAVVAPPTTA
ncbi:MAG: adenosylcobinamide amidohydrolase [Actinomycetota bacterium]|nr:adenosylcobinamide amidohydrolase [Actinomycetota bacterium]